MIKKNTGLPTQDKTLETTVLYVSLYSQFPATSYLPSVGMFFFFQTRNFPWCNKNIFLDGLDSESIKQQRIQVDKYLYQ